MREFAKIDITDQIDNHNFYGLDKFNDIIIKSLQQLSNMILEQDKLMIRKMSAIEAETYVNVETYYLLNDYMFWLDDEQFDKHTGVDCPVCAKKHRAEYMIKSLIRRWEFEGKRKIYEPIVHFRCDAIEEGRIIN